MNIQNEFQAKMEQQRNKAAASQKSGCVTSFPHEYTIKTRIFTGDKTAQISCAFQIQQKLAE